MAKEKKTKVHEFETHKQSCERCRSVEISKPKTLVNCCLSGAPMLKDYLNYISAPLARKREYEIKKSFLKSDDGKIYKTTKAKVNSEMKYK